MYLTYLDTNSWLIEIGQQTILLDPWLVGDLVFANSPWLFTSKRQQPRPIPDHIDIILLSQGLEDHAHIPTLKALDHSIPVVASPNAAKVVKKLGYSQITSLEHGDNFTLANQVTIKAVPGSPIGPTLVENGYLITNLNPKQTIYYEPHGFHSSALQTEAPIDVVIAPLIDIKIPFVGPVIKGRKSALQVAQWLQPQVMLPTAGGGDVEFSGILPSILRTEGNVAEFNTMLKANHLDTQVIDPQPGKKIEVVL